MATQKETIIIELDFDTDESIKQAAALNKNIASLTKSQKELKKEGREGSVQFQKNVIALKENRTALASTNKEIINLNKANKANAGSSDQLKAQLSLLTAERNRLSKADREGTQEGRDLTAQVNQTTEELKEQEEEVGNNTRSVGDYGSALGDTPFGSFIGGIKGMGAAFLANPLALIVTFIVLALKALFEAFKSTEEGENRIAKATAIISTIFTRLFDLLEPLASFIADVLVAAFEDLVEQMQAAAEGAEILLELLDFNDAADSLERFVATSVKAAESAALIADARAKTDKIDRELIVQTAKVAAQAANAREKALDSENLSAEERNKLLKESAAAIDALAAKEEKSAQLKFKAIKLENALTNSNKEALDAEAQAEADLFAVQQKRSDAQKSLSRDQLRVENEIKKAANDRVKAVSDAQKKAIAQTKDELALFIASQGKRAKTLEEQVKLAEQVRDKQLDILQSQLDAGLVTQTQFDIKRLAINQTFLEQQTEQVIDNADRELQIILDSNQSKLDANQFLSDELFVQEQERLQKSLEAQIAFEQQRKDAGIISQTEFNDAVNVINQQNADANAELEAEKKIAEEEQRLVDLALLREIDVLNREDEFVLAQEDLDRRKAQELANAETTGADLGLINAKFALLDKKLDQQKFASKVALASQTFGNLAAIAGKESAAGKAFAIAQTTIDTFVGAQAAFNSLASIPIVGSILGALAAAAAIAGGIARVNKIRNTKAPKAARGMSAVLGGAKHSGGGVELSADGVPFANAERGELVTIVNARNTEMLGSLSRLNQLNGNGDSFFKRGGIPVMQDGGVALSNISGGVDAETQQAAQFLDAVENLPAPVVAVEEINDVQADVKQVQVRAQV